MRTSNASESELQRVAALVDPRYGVEGEVGRGGMATVYRARDLKHGRPVAIKVLHPEFAHAIGVDRFGREIQIISSLQHPHILPLLDSGTAGDRLYYVMPFVEGPSLRDRVEQLHHLPVGEALRLGEQIANALAYAHSRQIVHLDIKPGNVMLSNGHAMLVDFGVARAICEQCSDRYELAGVVAGTPDYMSPEQVRGDEVLDGRSDVYGVGCLLYELLTGVRPFAAASAEAILWGQQFEDPMPVRSHRRAVAAAIDDLILKALNKDPGARPASAADFADALRAAQQTSSKPRPHSRRSRRVARLAGSLAALAGLAALPLAWTWESGAESEPAQHEVTAFAADDIDGQLEAGDPAETRKC